MSVINRSLETGGVEVFATLTRIDRTGRDLVFSDVFRSMLEKNTGVKFSAHAMERLKNRGINLQPDEISRLAVAIEKAIQKGVSDSLILVGDKAFIVSVENRTVVTALDEQSMRDTVFTNIDSAVIA